MDSLNRLQELFAKFPGIGPRQARRFVYYLLNKSPAYIKEFTDLLEQARKSTSECSVCHRLFTDKNQNSNSTNCHICSDQNRDTTSLMIVARDSDLESVEKSGAYHGLYFVLGGTIPIMDKEPDKRIRLEKLLTYVSNSSKDLKEIILSLNTTPEGENTAKIVKDGIERILGSSTSLGASKNSKTKITILGRGLSTGAELEYVDGETIKSALENRK